MPYLYIVIVSIIAFTHMIAPDHWLPLVALKARKGYSQKRTTSLSVVIGIAHGTSTTALSGLIVFVGTLYLSALLLRTASVIVLVVVALYITMNAFLEKEGSTEMQQASLFASIIPDPALVPIFLASASLGAEFISLLVIVFVVVTTVTIIAVVYLTSHGMLTLLKKVRPKVTDYIVSAMLLLTALYVLLF